MIWISFKINRNYSAFILRFVSKVTLRYHLPHFLLHVYWIRIIDNRTHWFLVLWISNLTGTHFCVWNKMNCELMLTYDTPVLRQTGSRNLTGTYINLSPNIKFLPSIVAEKNATKNGHIQNVRSMCIKINKVGKQEVGIWWVQKCFPWYEVPMWSLWPNIRSLPSIVAEKNVHICSMCIKTN